MNFLDSSWLGRIYSSISAGACSIVLTNPIWVIKTRLMSQVGPNAPLEARTGWHYRSTFHAASSIYRKEGVRAFHSGMMAAFLGLTHVGIQFPLYEYFKFRFTGVGFGEFPIDEAGQWIGILAATFLSKVGATCVTYPHEVLRTRMQTQQFHPRPSSQNGINIFFGITERQSYRAIVRTIFAEGGWRGLYSGMGTNMIRAIPAAMTTMLTYEILKTSLTRMREGRSMEEYRLTWLELEEEEE
jgi:solute carrier family 25 folate transporter 32